MPFLFGGYLGKIFENESFLIIIYQLQFYLPWILFNAEIRKNEPYCDVDMSI